MSLTLCPVMLAEAREYIRVHHRHHVPPVGHRFSIGVADGERICGVVTVGRPVARRLQDGWTLEVTRCCTDGTKNAASMLYRAAWRCARAMGYRRLITYTLASEPGTSLVAAGFRVVGQTPGRSWSCPSRPRVDRHPLGQKTLWEAA